MAAPNALEDILRRFDRYHPARIDLTLDRSFRLLAELGQPHQNLPPVIHVAGTNGKGSTIAFLRAIYEAAGLKVSTYTSPHLMDFTERFVLAGEVISKHDLYDLLNEVDAVNNSQPITEYEIVTATAFLALSRTPSDIVLLETGLGGRFDATNVIDTPLATVITPISLDHQAFLGPDIASIAAEKAAIQKSGVPSIIAPQPPEAARVIEQIGSRAGAIPFRASREWAGKPTPDGFTYQSESLSLSLPAPALVGAHQIINAATAIACVDQCTQIDVTERDITTSISQVRWPGRFERLPDGPLRRRLPATWDVWLDAGHNEGASTALAAALRQINADSPQPVHIIFGMLNDKDPRAFVGPLAELATSVTAVPLAGDARGHDTKMTAETLSQAGIAAGDAPSLEAALDALPASSGPARVLVCGSHLIVGAALRGNARPL